MRNWIQIPSTCKNKIWVWLRVYLTRYCGRQNYFQDFLVNNLAPVSVRDSASSKLGKVIEQDNKLCSQTYTHTLIHMYTFIHYKLWHTSMHKKWNKINKIQNYGVNVSKPTSGTVMVNIFTLWYDTPLGFFPIGKLKFSFYLAIFPLACSPKSLVTTILLSVSMNLHNLHE